ncbi:hypothetical protein DFH27DRAFT_294595 [Peziza echinospora]|nr:hypothetical protein DFH27DRAFT_294595 [Peziza echinospora]
MHSKSFSFIEEMDEVFLGMRLGVVACIDVVCFKVYKLDEDGGAAVFFFQSSFLSCFHPVFFFFFCKEKTTPNSIFVSFSSPRLFVSVSLFCLFPFQFLCTSGFLFPEIVCISVCECVKTTWMDWMDGWADGWCEGWSVGEFEGS